MLIIFLLYVTFCQSANQCAQCDDANYWYSCGAILYIGGVQSRCCNGQWCPCAPAPFPCDCCNKAVVDNATVLSDEYSYNSKGRLYTEYVTLAKFDSITNTYYAGNIVKSCDLKLNSQVIWPKFDVDHLATGNIMIKVSHLNMTSKELKCCTKGSTLCCGVGCDC